MRNDCDSCKDILQRRSYYIPCSFLAKYHHEKFWSWNGLVQLVKVSKKLHVLFSVRLARSKIDCSIWPFWHFCNSSASLFGIFCWRWGKLWKVALPFISAAFAAGWQRICQSYLFNHAQFQQVCSCFESWVIFTVILSTCIKRSATFILYISVFI